MGAIGTMKEDLLDLIKTKDEANKFFEFADVVTEKIYGTERFDKGVFGECVEEVMLKGDYKVKPLWLEKTCKQISRDMTPGSVKAALEKSTKLLSATELIKVEISFEPSQEFINEIYEVIKESGFGNFLLDIEFNPKLRGGAKFFIGGNYVNLTLNSVVAKYLRTKDVINRYL
jgi:hypothetical protein